jgi:hypothetical protein
MKDAVWITWESQRRNRELSRALGVRLCEWKEIDGIRAPVIKYGQGLARTARLLYRERPSLVFCQNPSLVLSAFLVGVKGFAGCRVCVDAHNVGLFPKEGRSRALRALSRFVQKRADLTIVTNEALACHVRMNGGRPFVLPDRIPDIPQSKPEKLKGRNNILFICSYAEDEPYQLVFAAARMLDRDIFIYVTGNYRKRGIDNRSVPENVVLLGFVPEALYLKMLGSVDATIDLTTREHCLVCGAYESVAAEKPQVLSGTEALRGYFCKGAVYTEHSPACIRDALIDVLRRKTTLREEARVLKRERLAEWELRKRDLLDVIARWQVRKRGAPSLA